MRVGKCIESYLNMLTEPLRIFSIIFRYAQCRHAEVDSLGMYG